MARADRLPWLRRDGAPLAVSLALHALLLLMLAPWLVVRTIPAEQVEVEVMIELDDPQLPRSRNQAALMSTPARPPSRPAKPQPVQETPSQPQPATRPGQTASAQPGQGRSGQSAPARRETAGMSARQIPAMRSAAAPHSAGLTALAQGSVNAGPVAPRPAGTGSTAQASARTVAALARPGEDRQDGPVSLTGPVPQAQAPQPEFRQAARQGGQASVRGGSRAPEDGLARQSGSPDQIALLASRVVPQALPGSGFSGGGQLAALAAPVPHSTGEGSVAAAESASSLAQPAAAAGTGAGAPSATRTPAPSGQSSVGAAGGSRMARPGEQGVGLQAAAEPSTASGPGAAAAAARPADRGAAASTPRGSGSGSVAAAEGASPGLAQLATPGHGAAALSRMPAPSGQGSSGTGSGSRTLSPEESGAGLMAAAPPDTSGPGTATVGTGPGAGVAGEGRAQRLGGSSNAERHAAATLLAAGGGAAVRGEAENHARLSGRADPPAPTQAIHEARAQVLQTQRPSGQARVVEERFTATALKVASPRSVCELPLMFAGFDRKPIPKGLDTINASDPMSGEIPPRHHPNNQAPRYPLPALGQRAEGRALVRAEIRPDGGVGQIWVKQSSGFPTLDAAALETVRAWRFYPARRHGLAVAMWMDVPIEYKVP